MINIFFLIIYFVLSGALSAVELYNILSVQALIMIIRHVQQNKFAITPLLIYYASVILINFANIELIQQIGTSDLKIKYIVPKYIDDAAELWCVSTTLLILGYQWAINKSLPEIGFEIKREKVLINLFWILFILNLMNAFGSGLNFRGGMILKLLGLLNSIAILFYARLWGTGNGTKYRNFAIILYILETYIALKTAYLRFELILPTGCFFLGYFIGKGNIRYLFSYRIIPLLIVVSFYSSVFKTLQEHRANFMSVIFSEKDLGEEDKQKNSGALLARSSNVAQMTNIIHLVKQNGFYNGAASEPLLAALIPRFIWPDKPQVALGQWFALAITSSDKNVSGTSNNSINMTLPGELYLDFGWIGVIIGSFLFGAFIPLLWNSTQFYASVYNLSGTVYGGYLFMLAVAGFASDLQIVITLISTYLTFYIVKRLSKSFNL